MGFFPTDAGDGDEVGPNTNGTYFKYVEADDKWIIIGTGEVYNEDEVDGLFTTHEANPENINHLTDAQVAALHTIYTLESHKTTHQNGGGDEISVAGLSGELADNQPPKSHALTVHTAGNDKIFYSAHNGTITELALGADGKVLKSNGPEVAPTWEDDITGGAGGDTDAIHDNVGGEINIITDIVPTVLDEMIIEDQSDSWAKKKCQLGDLILAGNVTGSLGATVVGNDTHTHDTRYYTEAEVNALLLAYDKIIYPEYFLAANGYEIYSNIGACWRVLMSDTSADAYCSFFVKKGGTFRVIGIFGQTDSNVGKTAGGTIYIGEAQNGESNGWNIVAGGDYNVSLTATAGAILIRGLTTDIVVDDDTHVGFLHRKDDNAGGATGYLYLFGYILERQ